MTKIKGLEGWDEDTVAACSGGTSDRGTIMRMLFSYLPTFEELRREVTRLRKNFEWEQENTPGVLDWGEYLCQVDELRAEVARARINSDRHEKLHEDLTTIEDAVEEFRITY